MDKTFKITIKLLTEKVKENLEKIQNNQKDIRNLLVKQDSDLRNEKLKKKYSVNETLIGENIDLIKVQLGLTSLLEKKENKTVPGTQEISAIIKEINDCLELTINGVLGSITDRNHIMEDNIIAVS